MAQCFTSVSYRTGQPWKSSEEHSEGRVLTGRADAGSWKSFRDRLTSGAHETLGTAASQRRQSSLPPQFADLVNRRRGERLNRDRPLYRSLRMTVSRALWAVEEARVRDVCERAGLVALVHVQLRLRATFRAIAELRGKARPRYYQMMVKPWKVHRRSRGLSGTLRGC